MRDKDGKITIVSFWKWLRSNKGKKYSFFIFYLFFFAVLFIYMSVSNNNVNNNDKAEETLPFKINKLQSDYTFSYYLKVNNDVTKYDGKKNGLNIILENDQHIYKYNYENNELIKDVDNNSEIYYEFLDIYNLKLLIKNSKYLSKTEYNDFQNSYNYVVTNEYLNDYFKSESKNQDLENSITVKTNSNNYIQSIEFNLVNFINSLNDGELLNYTVEINYGDINE